MIGAEIWSAWADRRQQAAAAEAPLRAVPAALPEPRDIPPREWLYGTRLIRRFVSVLAAPGGVGKSSLALGQALALVTGRPILGEHVHHAAPAWVLNLEDPIEETHRRVAALMQRHAIARTEVEGRLFLHSGRDRRVCMAETGDDGGVRHPDRDAIIDGARERGVGLIVVDPFVKSHRVDENSNGEIDAAATAWAEVADATRAAVLLVHHVRKGGATGDVEGARGAKALTDAARSAFLLAPMSVEEARRFCVDPADRWRHVRLDDAKANLAARSGEAALWYRLDTVALCNATPDYPHGDNVAAIAPWRPDFSNEQGAPYGADKGARHAGASAYATTGAPARMARREPAPDPVCAADRACALAAVAEGPGDGLAWHLHRGGRASDLWVGRAILDACAATEAQARHLIAEWLESGVLEAWPYRDPVQRKRRIGIRVTDLSHSEALQSQSHDMSDEASSGYTPQEPA